MDHAQQGNQEWKQEGLEEVAPKGQHHQEPNEKQKQFYTLMQGGRATLVHRQIHEEIRVLPQTTDPKSYIFSTSQLVF